jgi:hypothetical protein
MPTIELLNPQAHGHLRLRAVTVATPHFVQILAPEFALAAAWCPILFTKDATTGAFYAGAMFGFKAGENLLGTTAEAGFVPLTLQREGFFMSDRHIAIDRDHARFSDREGEPLFDDAREPGESLRAIQRTLGELHTGLEQTKSFIEALTSRRLVEPIDISIGAGAGRLRLEGLFTVSLDRLRDLDDVNALQLFRAGHLQLAYTMATSLRQISRLARLRERAS